MTFDEVMAAAPLLQVLVAERAELNGADVLSVLRTQLPKVSVRKLDVSLGFVGGAFSGMECIGPFAAALAQSSQPAPWRLSVSGVDFTQPAVLGALVDAVIARRLRRLTLEFCLPPAAAPLARLLAESSLECLKIRSLETHGPLIDEAGAALVANALRANTTLTKLNLCHARLFEDMRAAGALLRGLAGHASLREITIAGNETTADDRSEFGAALAALIAADAAALQVFDCCNGLEDAQRP